MVGSSFNVGMRRVRGIRKGKCCRYRSTAGVFGADANVYPSQIKNFVTYFIASMEARSMTIPAINRR